MSVLVKNNGSWFITISGERYIQASETAERVASNAGLKVKELNVLANTPNTFKHKFRVTEW